MKTAQLFIIIILALESLFISSSAQAAAPADEIICPAGSSKKGDKALLTVSASEQVTLFVCGQKEAQGKIKIHISDFEIWSRDVGGKNKLMEKEKAHDFRVWDDNKKLFVQEVTWFSGGWTPVFQWDLSCDEKTCTRSATKCAFDKDMAIKHQAQRELRDTKSEIQQKKTPDPSLFDSVKDSALTGNRESQNFFLKPDKNRHFTKDGEKIYSETQALLKRLLDANCL